MTRVRDGDQSAFEQVYRRHASRVYSYLWRLVKDDSLAADLSQDVFFRLWQARESWKESGSVAGYLVGVARNLAIDRHRRDLMHDRWRAEAEHQQPIGGPAPDVVLAHEDLAIRVHAAIDALPDRPREVFVLKRDAGLSYHEIALLLGISQKTVEVHMSKALRLLRESLSDLRETPPQ